MGSNSSWLGSLQEWEIRTQSLTEERLYEDTEMIIIYKPGREISEEMNPADTLILDFQPPELWEINVCYLNHLMCGILLWKPWKTNMISNPSANSLDFNWKHITPIWSFSTASYVPLIPMSPQLFFWMTWISSQLKPCFLSLLSYFFPAARVAHQKLLMASQNKIKNSYPELARRSNSPY